MDYLCDPLTTFNLVERSFDPSIFPQLKIKFHFFFKIEYLNHYLTYEISDHLDFVQEFPPAEAYASAAVAVGDSLSPDHIARAVLRAVGDLIPAANSDRCEDLIELAIKEARDSFPAARTLPKFCVLNLSFNVRVEHRHVHEYPFTIPDADAEAAAAFALSEKNEEEAFAYLETYEDGDEEEEEEEEERCCCICLEGLGSGRGGGGVKRMPCLHLFHGSCIKEWLRKSPSCPLCRYVPMEIQDSTIVC